MENSARTTMLQHHQNTAPTRQQTHRRISTQRWTSWQLGKHSHSSHSNILTTIPSSTCTGRVNIRPHPNIRTVTSIINVNLAVITGAGGHSEYFRIAISQLLRLPLRPPLISVFQLSCHCHHVRFCCFGFHYCRCYGILMPQPPQPSNL